MRSSILLRSVDDSSNPLTVALLERTAPLNAVNPGLTLAESKCLPGSLQEEPVEPQIQSFFKYRGISVR